MTKSGPVMGEGWDVCCPSVQYWDVDRPLGSGLITCSLVGRHHSVYWRGTEASLCFGINVNNLHRAKVLKPRLDWAVALPWSSSAPCGQKIPLTGAKSVLFGKLTAPVIVCLGPFHGRVSRGSTHCFSVISISAVLLLIQGNEILNLLNILPLEDSKCVALYFSSDIDNIPWRINFNSHFLRLDWPRQN